MKQIANLKANNIVGKIIENDLKVNYNGGPYEFKLNDGYGKQFNLYKKALKVAEWAEKNGAQVEIKDGQCYDYILVITDPVAANIEMFLKGL